MSLRPETLEFFRKRLSMPAKMVDSIDRNLEMLAAESDKYYHSFDLQQRGKTRKIDAPMGELKKVQKLLKRNFFNRMWPSTRAHGFVRHHSPLTNAKAHQRNAGGVFLLVDVKDFFHSITTAGVWRVTSRVLYKIFKVPPSEIAHREISETIVTLCTLNNCLPMGSPASPSISNLHMSWFDHQMVVYCARWGLTYTRYADDLTISSPIERWKSQSRRSANKAYPKVVSLLSRMGLRLNNKKTRVRRAHKAQEVTGIMLNSGKPTVSRKYRRLVRAATHQTALHVEKAFSPLCKDPRPMDLRVLRGMAGGCASVCPEHKGLLDEVQRIERLAAET